MRNKLITVIFITLFSFYNTASGQTHINSLYSRFNIGTLAPQGSYRSLGMGTVGTAMRDNNSIYFTNPASYSSFDTISFVFDFGVDYVKNYLSGGSVKYSSDDINFHHLIMGFPIAKGWGVAFGFVPMSNGYYNLVGKVKSSDIGYDPIIGEYDVLHSGNGSIVKYFIGTGLKVLKKISLGANMTILSGELNRANEFVFSDFNKVFHSSTTEKLGIVGINFDYGIQYSTLLRKNYFFNIGASVTSGNNYNSNYNQLSFKYTAYGSRDTISYISENNAKTFIPTTLKIGISFGKQNKFTTGLDFSATKWSSSKIPGSVNYAADTRSLAFGAEYIPDKYSNYSFINRMEYRFGGHIGDNYLIINGEQIKEYGVSVGIGIPLRRTLSKTNIFFDFTRKTGTATGKLDREDFLSMGISLNLYDYWFQKRKFD